MSIGGSADKYEKIVNLALRRGFFWPSYEIYGGVGGLYDLGPLGASLKKNIVEKWREWFIIKHQDYVVEIETPMIAPAKVFEASGHVEHFTDPIVECSKCGRVFRADKLVEEKLGVLAEGLKPDELSKLIKEHDLKCPECGGALGDVRLFNLLFQTTIGPIKGNVGYLRPEAAQGMFTAFKRVYEVMRNKIPIGIAQIGRVARNEISPRQGMIRLREFTIMEVEFFFDPEEPECPLLDKYMNTTLRILPGKYKVEGRKEPIVVKVRDALEEGLIVNQWLAYWLVVSKEFVKDLGISEENMFFEEKLPHERAHYSSQTFDQLVKVSRWGWIEVSGHSYRGDYDLSGHMKYSKVDLTVFKKYKVPKEIIEKKVEVDKVKILKTFKKDEVPKVFKLLSKISKEELIKLVESSQNVIKLDDIEIPKDVIKVVTVTKKIHGKKYVPHVVEPSFGAERLVYVVLEYAYTEEADRVVLKIRPDLAPIKVAVFPLVNKKELVRIAYRIYKDLMNEGFTVMYDDSGSIGRRYARADEVGVPYSVTVDYQTLEDNTVTIRYRDDKEQERIEMDKLISKIHELIKSRRCSLS